MHIFLTGLPGVGKSTIIKEVLRECNLLPSGYVTLPGNLQRDGSSEIFICPANAAKPLLLPQNRVGRREASGSRLAYPAVFDKVGVAILNDCQPPVIVMDELGFMEQRALLFQKKVRSVLQGSIPVLGVIKPRPLPFLETVKGLPNVFLLEVTSQNRAVVKNQAAAMLRQELQAYQ